MKTSRYDVNIVYIGRINLSLANLYIPYQALDDLRKIFTVTVHYIDKVLANKVRYD